MFVERLRELGVTESSRRRLATPPSPPSTPKEFVSWHSGKEYIAASRSQARGHTGYFIYLKPVVAYSSQSVTDLSWPRVSLMWTVILSCDAERRNYGS